jgi:hypothetical protein
VTVEVDIGVSVGCGVAVRVGKGVGVEVGRSVGIKVAVGGENVLVYVISSGVFVGTPSFAGWEVAVVQLVKRIIRIRGKNNFIGINLFIWFLKDSCLIITRFFGVAYHFPHLFVVSIPANLTTQNGSNNRPLHNRKRPLVKVIPSYFLLHTSSATHISYSTPRLAKANLRPVLSVHPTRDLFPGKAPFALAQTD